MSALAVTFSQFQLVTEPDSSSYLVGYMTTNGVSKEIRIPYTNVQAIATAVQQAQSAATLATNKAAAADTSASSASTSATNAATSASSAAASDASAAGHEAGAAAAAGIATNAAANAQASSRTATTWTVLSGWTASVEGTSAEVLDADTGTHQQASATGYDGATVPNAGRYYYSVGWGRWVWIGGTGLSGKLDKTTFDTAVRFQSAPGYSLAAVDVNNFPLWFSANDVDGGPLPAGVALFCKYLLLQYLPTALRQALATDALAQGGIALQSLPGHSAVVCDANGFPTFMDANDTDGAPTDYAAALIGKAIGLSVPASRSVLWRSLLAAAMAGKQVRIQCLGDSITTGVSGGSVATKVQSWPWVLGNVLQALGIPLGGDGFNSPFPAAVPDSRWTFGGTWKFQPGETGQDLVARTDDASGAYATYTGTRAAVEAAIVYFGAFGGSAQVTIDGVVVGTITSSGGSQGIRVQNYAGLSNTTHTIRLDVTGGFGLVGVSTHGPGLVIDNIGRSGAGTPRWLRTNTNYSLRNIYAALVAAFPSAVFGSIIALGTNDCIKLISDGDGATVADYTTNMQALVDICKVNGPVQIMSPGPFANTQLNGPIASYIAAAKTIAANNDLNYLDLYARWVNLTTAQSRGLLSSDNLHPGALGYADIARAHKSLISA